jgi:hypothetical protein
MPVGDIVFQDNFERGVDGLADDGRFDSETDTESQLDIPHYTELAKTPGLPMPYSGGAYCVRCVPIGAGTPADAFLVEADLNMATTNTHWFRFNMWLDPDFKTTTTADDNFAVFELQDTANKEIFAFGLDYDLSSDVLYFGVGGAVDNAVPDTLSTTEVPLGKWFTVELKVHLVTAGATGDITAYVTEAGGTPSATATVTKGSVQGLTITHGVLGMQDHKSTTNGTILLDNFMMETQRIWPQKNRFSETIRMTQSGHVFVGAGTVEKIVSNSGSGTAGTYQFFDTDTGQIYPPNQKDQLRGTVAGTTYTSTNTPFDVTRGLFYHDSDGTNVDGTWALDTDPAETFITISRAPGWFSDGNMRRYAGRRNLTG